MKTEFCTAPVFGNDMVLQSGKALPVWGSAEPGTAVDVAFSLPAGKVYTMRTHADASGRWRSKLPAMSADGPCTLTLQNGDKTLRYQNVWLGEVWLAGGQSNMELTLANSAGGQEAVADCTDPRLHFYAVPKVSDPLKIPTAGRWRMVTPENAIAGELSAVAYYAARRLAQTLDVHVGILQCCWGGTYAHCWMPRELLRTFPEGQARIAWYDARMGSKSDAQFEAEMAAYQRRVDAWNDAIAARRTVDPDVSWSTLNREVGLFPWPPPAGRAGYQRPGNLYETMLRTVAGYAVRGFWYYQGEQDEEWPHDYQALLTALVRRWRADWSDSEGTLPFLLVQLPMYATSCQGAWPVLREAQAQVAAQEPHVGLVALTDCGEEDNIHPTDKYTPGTRLALLALQTVYDQPVQGLSPNPTHCERKGALLTVRFANADGALDLRSSKGFELAGPDGMFFPAQAERTDADTISLRSAAVPQPVFARYEWYDYAPASLFGGSGLPAAPFRCKAEI